MPIIKSGYAKHRRNGSTRAHRKARARALTRATVCWICGKPETGDDPFEADHVHAFADHGDGELRPAHRSCNRRRGRGTQKNL